ncbi:hypothetical protein DJ66_0447 [Candidatus Liberibacter solanacearum]|uniref:Uncharacterized protein n=1 Tax=Candidatus Liberibacter solanacearum TaxID=556287 RepID=A0A0F4VKG0_9HYPH|nr:hypothetical protein DJ66_0447 [Candidatus Liberibacter solanacearum]
MRNVQKYNNLVNGRTIIPTIPETIITYKILEVSSLFFYDYDK